MNELIQVYILDDQKDECDLYSKMVKDAGYLCNSSVKSEEAFKFMKTNKIDVLLLDVYLKEEQNGLALIPKFKQANPEIIILVITHNTNIDDCIEAIRGGAFDYILKPFDNSLFKQRLNIAVEKVKYERLKKQHS